MTMTTDIERSNSLRDLAARINAEHTKVVHGLKAPMEHGIAAGHLLIEAKEQIKRKYGHGHWLPWVRKYCLISERTAQLYMLLAKHESEIRNCCGFADAVAFLTKKHREAKVIDIKERRLLRVEELAVATHAASKALGEKLYGVIYADPPWFYDNVPMGDGHRLIENHYPTMALDDIKALPVHAADDCILFMWATVPLLAKAFEVLDAWDFEYRSMSTWVKDKIGIGYWVRSQCEHLLLATKGDVPSPAPGEQYPAVIGAPRGRHSEKPDIFAKHIERIYPNVPKLEMFARAARPGWDVWGNEAEAAE
jgi:N6-adenosine-specific RNA methylase IME4